MTMILGPIFSFLKLIPWWAYAIAIALSWGAWQRHQVKSVAAEYQQAQEKAATERQVALEATITETSRRLKAQTEVAKNADNQAVAARAAAARASDAAERVRLRFSAVEAGSRGSDSAAASASKAASAPSVLLRDVFGRCVERVRQLAEYADSARIAGQACESAYGSLTR
jgi:hypothetical protein